MRARPLPLGDALGFGLRRATRYFPATLFLFATEALDVCAGMLAFAGLYVGLAATSGAVAMSALAFVATLWLAAQLLRPIIVAAALRQTGSEERGEAARFETAAMGEAGAGASYFVYALYVGSLIGAFNALSIGATFVAWVMLLGSERGALGSAALAGALVLAMALGFFGRLWLKLGLVRAVLTRQPLLPSLYDAIAQLAADPLRIAAVAIVFGVVSGLLEASLAGAFAAFARGTLPFGGFGPFLLFFAAPLAGGLVAAFVSAFFQHAQWQALAALELASATGPQARADPLHDSTEDEEPILPALPVEGPAEG